MNIKDNIMDITIKGIKVTSLFLLCWYSIIRYLLLSVSNPASQEWLANPFSHTLAVLSQVYLVYLILVKEPQRNKFFVTSTIAMFILNGFCLISMTILFIKQPTTINFGYENLDLAILLFYGFTWRFCFLDNKNNNAELPFQVHL